MLLYVEARPVGSPTTYAYQLARQPEHLPTTPGQPPTARLWGWGSGPEGNPVPVALLVVELESIRPIDPCARLRELEALLRAYDLAPDRIIADGPASARVLLRRVRQLRELVASVPASRRSSDTRACTRERKANATSFTANRSSAPSAPAEPVFTG